MTGSTSGAGTVHSYGITDFTLTFSDVYLVHVVQLFFSSCCDVCHSELKNDVRSVLTPICFVIMFMLYLCSLYLFTHPKRLPYRIMLVLLNRNTTDVTCGAGTVYPSIAPEFTPSF